MTGTAYTITLYVLLISPRMRSIQLVVIVVLVFNEDNGVICLGVTEIRWGANAPLHPPGVCM